MLGQNCRCRWRWGARHPPQKDAVILSTSALLNSIAGVRELPPSEISVKRERAFSPKTFQTVFFT